MRLSIVILIARGVRGYHIKPSCLYVVSNQIGSLVEMYLRLGSIWGHLLSFLIANFSVSAVTAMRWLIGRGNPTTDADSTPSASTQRPGPVNGQDELQEPLQIATLIPAYTTAEDLQTGPPNLVESSGEGGGSVVQVQLPPGISSVQHWGRNLFAFGKYTNTNMSYSDLYHSTVHEQISYVEWIRTHTKETSSPEFKDFANYVSQMDLLSGQTQSIVIPGSQKARKFKRDQNSR